MARTNIDHRLFTDRRFFKLCLQLESRREAIGALVEAYMLAQQFVGPENPLGYIPRHDWDAQELPQQIIDVGLAHEEDDCVRMCGAEEEFAWLNARQKAARRGGEANKLRLAAKRAAEAASKTPTSTTSTDEPAQKSEAKLSQTDPSESNLSQTDPNRAKRSPLTLTLDPSSYLYSSKVSRHDSSPPPEPDGSGDSPSGKFDPESLFPFVYAAYPRKEGKSRGKRTFLRRITSRKRLEDLTQAITRYRAQCAGKDPQFVKVFSTFMNEFEDWLDPETGSCSLPPPPTPEVVAEKPLGLGKTAGAEDQRRWTETFRLSGESVADRKAEIERIKRGEGLGDGQKENGEGAASS